MRETIVIPVEQRDEVSETLALLDRMRVAQGSFTYHFICEVMGIRPLPAAKLPESSK